MATSALSRRYASALISLAKEENNVDKIAEDLSNFNDIWNDGGGSFKNAMLNPGISVQERSDVLKTVLSKVNLHANVSNLILLLMEKGRLVFLSEIQEAFSDMADEFSGRIRAEVTTAREIDISEQNNIRQTLATTRNIGPEKLMINFEVNPEIIGGIIARVGDTIYDASIASRLQSIKQELI